MIAKPHSESAVHHHGEQGEHHLLIILLIFQILNDKNRYHSLCSTWSWHGSDETKRCSEGRSPPPYRCECGSIDVMIEESYSTWRFCSDPSVLRAPGSQ